MTGYSEAQHIREVALARLLSANVMGLLHDPTGVNLPDELWKQRLKQAKELLQRECTSQLGEL